MASFSEPALAPFFARPVFPAGTGAAAGSAFGAGAACLTACTLAGATCLTACALAGAAALGGFAGAAFAWTVFAGVLAADLRADLAASGLCNFAFAFGFTAARAGLWGFALAATVFAAFLTLARAAGALRAEAFLACLFAVLLKVGASEKRGLDKRAEIYHGSCRNPSGYFGCPARAACPFARISN